MREIAFGVAFSLVVALAAFLAAAWPVPGRPVMSYFPEATAVEAAQAVALAGGRLLQIGENPSLVISIGDRSDYTAELYRAGAWLVTDASLARLCMNRLRDVST
jgi:hypothetical protein